MEDVIEEVPDLSAMQRLKQSYIDLQKSVKHTLSCAKLLLKEGAEKLKTTRDKVLEKLSSTKTKFLTEKTKKILQVSVLSIVGIGMLFNPKDDTQIQPYNLDPQYNVSQVQTMDESVLQKMMYTAMDNFQDLEDVVKAIGMATGSLKSEEEEEIEKNKDVPSIYGEHGEPPKQENIVVIDGREYYVLHGDNKEYMLDKTQMDEELERELNEKNKEENVSQKIK